MPKKDNISLSVIKRLPRYYRFLGVLKEKGINRISSKELSQKMNITASQIRQDLNCFGGFGQQGYGYNVEDLHQEIGQILGVNDVLSSIVIGAGNLGRAVSLHIMFESKGFNLTGIFDKKEAICGKIIRGIPVRHIDQLEEFCLERLPKVAVLCIPRDAALETAEQLCELGIKGIWNFSHYDFTSHFNGIRVENVHLSDSLMTLSYYLNENNNA